MKIIDTDKRYNILITDEVAYKISSLVEICNIEISGLGTVLEKDSGELIIDGLYIFKQKCGPAHTQLDQVDVSNFYTSMIEQGKEDELNRMKFWWHSHVDMPVFWSGTDIQNIMDLNNSDYLVSIVSNKREQHRASLKLKSPSILLDNIHVGIINRCKNPEEIYGQCEKEVTEKVLL